MEGRTIYRKAVKIELIGLWCGMIENTLAEGQWSTAAATSNYHTLYILIQVNDKELRLSMHALTMKRNYYLKCLLATQNDKY